MYVHSGYNHHKLAMESTNPKITNIVKLATFHEPNMLIRYYKQLTCSLFERLPKPKYCLIIS